MGVRSLSEIEKARIAMAIDCEGCITASVGWWKKYHKRDQEYECFSIKTSVFNTNKILLEWLQDSTSLGNIKPIRKVARPNCKLGYEWVIFPNAMRELLPIILPYFLLKRRQAELAIEFLSITKSKRSCLPEEKKQRKRKIVSEMQKLNKRGVKV